MSKSTTLRGLVAAVLASLALAGCGSGSSSAADVTAELNAVFPAPNARDNTHSCEDIGCEQRITTDAVTVTEFGSEADAMRIAAAFKDVSDARQAGRFVLTFIPGGTSTQQFTSDEARDAYTAKTRELAAN